MSKWKKLYFFIAVPLLAVAVLVYHLVDRHRVHRELDDARSVASATTTSATTPDDARRWLEQNGYSIVFWNPHDPRGFIGVQDGSVDGKHLIVQGQRPMRIDDGSNEPRYIDLTFRFTLEGQYANIQADPNMHMLPTSRPAGQ